MKGRGVFYKFSALAILSLVVLNCGGKESGGSGFLPHKLFGGTSLASKQSHSSTVAACSLGEFTVTMTCTAGCTGFSVHSMTIDSWNATNGTFSGTGYMKSDPGNTTWDFTGSVTSTGFNIYFVYTGTNNPGYNGTINGTFSKDGTPETGSGTTSQAQTISWLAERDSAGPPMGNGDFSVLTFNTWLTPPNKWYPDENSTGAQKLSAFASEISRLEPDFILLQEGVGSLVEFELRKRGYCMTDQIDLQDHLAEVERTRDLITASRHIPELTDAQTRPTMVALESDSSVGNVMRTCTAAGDTPLCILNVHSQAYLKGTVADQDREALSTIIRNEAAALKALGKTVIIGGDFNAAPTKTSIGMLRDKGFLNAWQTEPSGFTFIRKLRTKELIDPLPAGNGIELVAPRRIDHLFAYGSPLWSDQWLQREIIYDNAVEVSGQFGVFGIFRRGAGPASQFGPLSAYDVTMTCTPSCGVNAHRMRLASWDPVTGDISGTGYYVPDPANTIWDFTGNIAGSNYTITFRYTGVNNPGYNGTVSGTFDSASGAFLAANGTTSQAQNITFTGTRISPNGTYDISRECTTGCSGTTLHTMTIANWNASTGTFTASGFEKANPSNTWTGSGTMIGLRYTMNFAYTVGGYTGDIVGTVDGTGGLNSGTGTAGTDKFIWGSARVP